MNTVNSKESHGFFIKMYKSKIQNSTTLVDCSVGLAGCATVQREHLCHTNSSGLSVRGRRQRSRHQRAREGQTVGNTAQGRREASKRASESAQSEGKICSDCFRLRQWHWLSMYIFHVFSI